MVGPLARRPAVNSPRFAALFGAIWRRLRHSGALEVAGHARSHISARGGGCTKGEFHWAPLGGTGVVGCARGPGQLNCCSGRLVGPQKIPNGTNRHSARSFVRITRRDRWPIPKYFFPGWPSDRPWSRFGTFLHTFWPSLGAVGGTGCPMVRQKIQRRSHSEVQPIGAPFSIPDRTHRLSWGRHWASSRDSAPFPPNSLRGLLGPRRRDGGTRHRPLPAGPPNPETAESAIG